MYYKILITKRYKNGTIYKGRYAIPCHKDSASVLDKIERILEKEEFQRDSVYFDTCFKKNDVMVYISYDVNGVLSIPYKIIKIEDLIKKLED